MFSRQQSVWYAISLIIQNSELTLKNEPVAVIIGSQEMKSMNCIEFFETILAEHPDPIRLIISEVNDAEALISAINKGQVFRYIPATSDPNELQQSLDVSVKIFLLEKKKRQQLSQMREESLKRERILSLFTRYVPRQVVDETLSKEAQNVFGGEQRNITILFASIKDLTRLTETISPDKTLPYLNSYFSFISQCVEEHKGIVDKLIGNTFLALFGAPISYLNNEANAVYCGLDILEKLKKFNEKHVQPMGFQTEVSIGIHSGEAIIGNIGSHQYISYTAVGDTVNTTSHVPYFRYFKKNT